MVTAADMRQIRENKSKVNHETYKSIYRQITRRIETHGKLGALDLVAKIPHYVTYVARELIPMSFIVLF